MVSSLRADCSNTIAVSLYRKDEVPGLLGRSNRVNDSKQSVISKLEVNMNGHNKIEVSRRSQRQRRSPAFESFKPNENSEVDLCLTLGRRGRG